ncbi:MAG: universal stress protein [Anaerolineae bacterium]|nr:universal stress protein [Anaerolineae bacterium]
MVEFKRILVPLDGSPLSERALPAAAALAEKFDGRLILLHVLDIPTPTLPALYPEIAIGWVEEAREQAHREAQRYLEKLRAALEEQGLGVEVLLRDTSPAEDILDVATTGGVDLIVMSTHGQGGLARWTFGSVADKVARHSPCPVLLVRQKPDTAGHS